MDLKKKELVVGSITIFALGFLIHFLYDWFPYYLVSIFAPVNESIWEHMKLFFTGVLIYMFIDIFTHPTNTHNFIFAKVMSIIAMIVVFLIIYYPLYMAIGYNTLLTLVFFFIAIVFGQYVSYRIRTETKRDYSTLALYILFAMIYVFVTFTYSPPHIELFRDPMTNKFGK